MASVISLETARASNAERNPAMPAPQVSVVLAAWNEGANIGPLIDRIQTTLKELALTFEIIVVDGGSKDETWAEAEKRGARCLLQRRIGYGGAVREGFSAARGDYVLTMDCDLSHPPELFKELWAARQTADVLVGSRFVLGGASKAPPLRKLLSEILNFIFSSLLRVPIKDSSSGYRLYSRKVLKPDAYTRENFNVLQEVLVKAYADGFSVRELPLHYEERATGESHVSLARFAMSYLPTLYRLWLLRNSTESADYDAQAYNSRHFLQRYWQRRRYALLEQFSQGEGLLADIGCGSGAFIMHRPDAVAVDLAFHKLRFLKPTNPKRIRAEAECLPFRSGSFSRAVVSQVLQYISPKSNVFEELNRVTKMGGTVVISVPDSGRIEWKIIGWLYHRLLPNVYGAEERATFSRHELMDQFAESGFRVLRYRYICGAELVMQLTKVEECNAA